MRKEFRDVIVEAGNLLQELWLFDSTLVWCSSSTDDQKKKKRKKIYFKSILIESFLMDLTEFEEERSQEWLTESLAHGKIQLSLTKPRKVEKKKILNGKLGIWFLTC